MDIKEFNNKIKNEEIDILIEDTHDDLFLINSAIAHKFIGYVAEKLGEIPYEAEHKNASKKSNNLFQMECYLESGNIIWATFVHIDNKHQVIKSKSSIELLDGEYNTIKKIL